MKIWIVGKVIEFTTYGSVWIFCGAYSDKKKAETHCSDGTYFVGPAEVDQAMPDEREDWPGAYYPRRGK